MTYPGIMLANCFIGFTKVSIMPLNKALNGFLGVAGGGAPLVPDVPLLPVLAGTSSAVSPTAIKIPIKCFLVRRTVKT